ncbi:hypothetical protein HOD83_01535 [Candidatus Woesearchaeota archaeon]|jgi:hypothetical protein|nr:hypothetical protein [Candidatus Woesearchaeota archaeon]MBT4114586.1 hypothetical protein [Candidatus Woesearchaeota archaeon]MBT4248253.1 hypothetical protein [Candidatus Woesearchaeota archaeon]
MRTLTNQRALDFLKLYHIPTMDYTPILGAHLIRNFPCVFKVDSPKILHKAEHKVVHVVHHKDHAESKFHALRKKGNVISQRHVDGHEFVIQVFRPPRGKMLILLGIGGIPTDVHEHFSVRPCPVALGSARKMIDELRASEYITTFSGKKTKVSSLEKTIVALSKLALKENVKAIEIDPFILNHKFGGVADAKIVA